MAFGRREASHDQMQDRYAGDVGEFQKYGLLRELCRPTPGATPVHLGVCWCLADDEPHNNDGKRDCCRFG